MMVASILIAQAFFFFLFFLHAYRANKMMVVQKAI
jgi:hypothetical protein